MEAEHPSTPPLHQLQLPDFLSFRCLVHGIFVDRTWSQEQSCQVSPSVKCETVVRLKTAFRFEKTFYQTTDITKIHIVVCGWANVPPAPWQEKWTLLIVDPRRKKAFWQKKPFSKLRSGPQIFSHNTWVFAAGTWSLCVYTGNIHSPTNMMWMINTEQKNSWCLYTSVLVALAEPKYCTGIWIEAEWYPHRPLDGCEFVLKVVESVSYGKKFILSLFGQNPRFCKAMWLLIHVCVMECDIQQNDKSTRTWAVVR